MMGISDPGILMVFAFRSIRIMLSDLRIPDLESHLRTKDSNTLYLSPKTKDAHRVKRRLALARARLHEEREAFASTDKTSRDE